MRELVYPLKRLWFALWWAGMSFRMGWNIAGGIHAEAQRVERERREQDPLDALVLADQALYDDVLLEAGTGVLRRAGL